MSEDESSHEHGTQVLHGRQFSNHWGQSLRLFWDVWRESTEPHGQLPNRLPKWLCPVPPGRDEGPRAPHPPGIWCCQCCLGRLLSPLILPPSCGSLPRSPESQRVLSTIPHDFVCCCPSPWEPPGFWPHVSQPGAGLGAQEALSPWGCMPPGPGEPLATLSLLRGDPCLCSGVAPIPLDHPIFPGTFQPPYLVEVPRGPLALLHDL